MKTYARRLVFPAVGAILAVVGILALSWPSQTPVGAQQESYAEP